MLSQHLQNSAAAPDFQIQESQMDAALQAAVMRMLGWCARQPQGAAFMARGFVVDTLGDIGRQITEYFPSSMDVAPILDDMGFVIGESAKKSGQRFQEVMLDYIGDGKIPEAARANIQSFVKWYSAGSTAGSDFDGYQKHLKPGWSGGAGGSGMDMLKHLNLGTKKGFLLQVCALDITNMRTQALLADMPAMQAFGGTPEAVAQAAEAMAQGGAQGEAVQSLADNMIEIKTIRAALSNAQDTPLAAPLAAALAVKVEALSSRLATETRVPAAARAEGVRVADAVKADMTAQQITNVISTIAQAMPVAVMARTANDVPAAKSIPVQIARAIEAVQIAAKAADIPVKSAIALAMAKEAPVAVREAVTALTRVMAQPAFLPSIEAALPPAAAQNVRAALTVPALQAVGEAPARIMPVRESLKATMAALPPETPSLPTLKIVAQVLEQVSVTPSSLRAQPLNAIVENLQAVSMTQSLPESVKPALAVLSAQVEVLAIQAVAPAPAQPQMPVPLPPQAPLAVLAAAVDVAPPALIQPPRPPENTPVKETKAEATVKADIKPDAAALPGPAAVMPVVAPVAAITPVATPVTPVASAVMPAQPQKTYESPVARAAEQSPVAAAAARIADMPTMRAPVVAAPAASVAAAPRAAQPAESKAEAAKPNAAKGGCADCKKGFNCSACATMGDKLAAQMHEGINTKVISQFDIKPPSLRA